MKDRTIRKIALCGILAAAIVLLTMLVSIPIPGGLGFVNLVMTGKPERRTADRNTPTEYFFLPNI